VDAQIILERTQIFKLERHGMPKHKGVYDTVFSGENNTIVGVDNKNAILS
jgi:hypothetical protein